VSGECYDYIVVGAGASGCAAAYRLVRDHGASVLLLEAGGPDAHPGIGDGGLAATLGLWGESALDWGCTTEPQPGLGGRRIAVTRGRVWGGSTALNAMLYVRGDPRDYDGWAAAGNEGWSYRDVLPRLRAAEDYDGGPDDFRGTGGPLAVSRPDTLSPVAERLFDAAAELGFKDAGPDFDYNAARQDGSVFRYQATRTRRGRRVSAASAYLRPLLGHPRFTVRDRATVLRIELDRGRAVGVRYAVGGRAVSARAEHEVILAAGAFGSPHLLLRSGIGPAADLAAHGVPVAADLPGVGRNLHDHLMLSVCRTSRRPLPQPSLIAETGLFAHTRTGPPNRPADLQLSLAALLFPAPADTSAHGYTVAVCLTRPRSRGTLTLRSADPAAPPRIDPGYLTDPADADALVAGIELARELLATSAYAEFAGAETLPGPDIATRADLRRHVRAAATTLWHPAGTCRMGRDPLAVVDPRLRVHGVGGLRVADASAMPRLVTGNPAAACVLIGESAAALIGASP
jgi:choline dehydrogenase